MCFWKADVYFQRVYIGHCIHELSYPNWLEEIKAEWPAPMKFAKAIVHDCVRE